MRERITVLDFFFFFFLHNVKAWCINSVVGVRVGFRKSPLEFKLFLLDACSVKVFVNM